jgi:outer membrane protein assembly factor BamA
MIRLSLRTILVPALVLCSIAHASNEWTVRSVDITGNAAIKKKTLLSLMETRPARIWRKAPYSPSRLHFDLRTMDAYYRENGYLDATVTLSPVRRDTAHRQVRIDLLVSEGKPTLIDTVVITGLPAKRERRVRHRISVKPGGRLGANEVRKNSAAIKSALAVRGRLYARVHDSIAIEPGAHRAAVIFAIDNGPICLAGPVHLEGLALVRPEAVRRELRFSQGDTLTSRTLERSVKDLYTTGLFDFVRIEPATGDTIDRRASLTVPLTLSLDEAKFFTVDATAGYGTFDHFRASVRSAYANLFGLGHRIAVDGTVNRFSQRVELSYGLPWPFSQPVGFETAAYIERHDVTYRGLFQGMQLSLTPRRRQLILYRLWAKYERTVWLEKIDTLVEPRKTQSVGVDLTHDARSTARNGVTRGGLFRFTPELAGVLGRGSNQYYRGIFDLRGYADPAHRIKLSAALCLGYAHVYGPYTAVIPPQARYYIGSEGMRPVRGFPTDREGGTVALVANLFELRVPLYKWFGLTLFSDAGQTADSLSHLSWKDALWVAGPGLSITTPIGDLCADFAWRLKGGQGWGTPFFSVGSTF